MPPRHWGLVDLGTCGQSEALSNYVPAPFLCNKPDMLFYVCRVVVLMLRQFFARRIQPHDTLDVAFRAWPWACDLNFHVNNAQHLLYMELGRWAYTLRLGLLGRVFRDRVQLLVGGTSILYRRPLPMFRRFTVRTRVLAADPTWFYFLQEILDHRDRIAVRAIIRGTARKDSKVVPAGQVFGDIQFDAPESSNELRAFMALAEQHLEQL